MHIKRELPEIHSCGKRAHKNNVFENQNKMPKFPCCGTWEQCFRRIMETRNVISSEITLYAGTSWDRAASVTVLPVCNSSVPVTEKIMVLTQTANEISQKLKMNEGLRKRSPW